MRLIDADALCAYANNQRDKSIDANDIMRFPTIDAVPLSTGGCHYGSKEEYYGHPWVCESCGTAWMAENDALDDEGMNNYCPHCGRKMINSEEGEDDQPGAGVSADG